MMNDVLSALDALPPGEAVFDLDGTLILGDVGESVLRLLIARGPLPPLARATLGVDAPWAAYEALDHVTQSVVAAEALQGLTPREAEALVDTAFADGSIAPNPPVCELAAAIARRHRVWMLTGSAEVLGRAVGPRVGVRHVTGVRVAVADGRFTGRVLEPVPVAAGKIAVSWMVHGRRPVFAIGDSPWDAHILRLARVGRSCGRSAGVEFPAFP